MRSQVCHLSGVIVAKELMEGDRSCQMCGLGWECRVGEPDVDGVDGDF